MLGEADVDVGGGVESMSRAPWAVPKPERVFPTGNTTMYDTTLGWRFVNPRMEEMGHTDSLGMTAENLAQERFLLTPGEDAPDEVVAAYDVSREAQDRFALRSHEKAVAAMDEKRFREEIVPVALSTSLVRLELVGGLLNSARHELRSAHSKEHSTEESKEASLRSKEV